MAFKPMKVQVQSKGFAPTEEQVINANYVKEGKDVKIIAGAGSGKTSTLRYIAEQVPDKNILVLCFNKANADECNSYARKPENIFYATINAIAYAHVVDTSYRKKLSFLSYKDLEEYSIAETCKLSYREANAATKSIINAITTYCRSDKTSLDEVVQDYLFYEHSIDSKNPEKPIIFTRNVLRQLKEIAESYWHKLTNPKNPASISHDVYLKLFQLRGTKLKSFYDKQAKRFIDIDILTIDEAQDTNPVCEAIFRNQDHLQRIIVGDPMQQLYTWRGAKDIMSMPQYGSFTTGFLSESFRFNQDIADKANYVLAKAGSALQLKGSGTKTEITSKAILCRTNASVVETLLDLIVTEPDTKLYTSIDLKDVFSKLYHMEAAWFNTIPRYPCKELAHIVDKTSLLKAIELSDEVARLHNLRQSLVGIGQTLTSVKKLLDERLVETMDEAEIVVSTIHKSKGLQWSHITISEDFLYIDPKEGVEAALDRLWGSHTLMCLLYVAVTRAEVELVLPWYLKEVKES